MEAMRRCGSLTRWDRASLLGALAAIITIEQISRALMAKEDLPGQRTSIYCQKCQRVILVLFGETLRIEPSRDCVFVSTNVSGANDAIFVKI